MSLSRTSTLTEQRQESPSRIGGQSRETPEQGPRNLEAGAMGQVLQTETLAQFEADEIARFLDRVLRLDRSERKSRRRPIKSTTCSIGCSLSEPSRLATRSFAARRQQVLDITVALIPHHHGGRNGRTQGTSLVLRAS